MVKCRPVERTDHEKINSWNNARCLPFIAEHMFPDVGYVVDDIAAGFLYQTDSSLCFIDGYISNPASDKAERKEAFDLITDNIIRAAKDHGFLSILAYTQHPEIMKRCVRYHFTPKGVYSLFTREL